MIAAVLSLLSGTLLALCLPRPGICVLAWIGLAPLILAASRRTWLQSFFLGWSAGVAFHAVAFYWIFLTCRFAGVSLPVCALAWVALAAFQGLAWGVSAGLARGLSGRLPRPLAPWAWALAWTAVAVVCERWTPRLPGDLLEYTQWRWLPILQISSVAGPHFLGFVIVLANAALARLVDEEADGLSRLGGAAAMLAALVLAGGSLFYGTRALAARRPGGPAARVEILQPAVDQYQKWDERYRRAILDTYKDLIWRPRTAMPQLVVWPEAGLPFLVREGQVPSMAALAALRTRAPQLVGIMTKPKEGELLNSLVSAAADGSFRGVYYKRELVPFGEYVPFASVLRPRIGKLNELGGIGAGASVQTLFETPFGPAAGSICYEAVFPRWARRDAARGARLIVNVTNDGWYKETWGPYQHFQTNVFRAIENRVSVIRAGNTGISGVIDPWGVTLARLELGERGRLDADVPLSDAFPMRSFYARHGDWFGALCLAAVVLLAAMALRYGSPQAARPALPRS